MKKLIECVRLDRVSRLYLVEKIKTVSYFAETFSCQKLLYERLRRQSLTPDNLQVNE